MRTNFNSEVIVGRLYSKNIQEKAVANKESKNFGKSFISGTLEVATDEACLNVLQVHYTYVTAETKAGKTNASYVNLKSIMESGKTIIDDGKDAAWKVRLTPAIALNDFYPQGQTELISTPRNEGGFVTILTGALPPEGIDRNKFTVDMLINGTHRVEADPDRNILEDYLEIKGAIFNFRNNLLPMTFIAHNPEAINYFESLDASPSNPVYTKIWGKIESRTVSVEKKTESAFGGDAVDVTQKHVREYVVTGAAVAPYEFGTPETMTAEDVKKMMADREVLLADVKKRSDDYYASRNTAESAIKPAASANTAVPVGGFKF